MTPKQRRQKALDLAREVGLPDPERIVRAYPHQLSGGQRQRAMIAMALALEPAVLVADEPTTALDVTTQAQILKLIRDLQRRRNMAVMFITHDFGVVADIADRVVVLRHGQVVEQGSATEVLTRPQHAYTQALLAAVPSMHPPLRAPLEGRAKAVEVIGLDKTYVTPSGWFRPDRKVQAASEVNFTILKGETLGLVGESGSGKSSVARLVMRLIAADRGTVRIGDVDLTSLDGQALRAQRRRIQMIFQDPFASLNPRRKIGDIIADGPIAYGAEPKAAMARASDLLGLVGLDAGALRALSARILRRPAPAHRHRPRAGARSGNPGRRRGRLGARRLGAGAGPEAAGRPEGAARPLDAVHHPRSARRRANLRPHRGDAARRDRRAEADARTVRRSRSIPTRANCSPRCPASNRLRRRPEPMRCVLLSKTLNMRAYLASEITRLTGQISFVDHRDGHSAADVRMAVAWHPPADAFDHYPNLKAVCSIGAGADNILRCPSLRDGIDVVRVVDPAQARMMSGFVIWHVIWPSAPLCDLSGTAARQGLEAPAPAHPA